MGTAKLKDVAEAAGVSLATASLVLNGKGQFSNHVKSRVLKAAETLKYQKNVYASSMASKKVTHIGILVHEDYEKAFEWNFIRRIFIHLEAVITKEEYFPVILPVSMHQSQNKVLEKVMASGAGGVFTIHYIKRELFRQLEDRNIPVVIINAANLQQEFSTICVDDFQGAYEGTKYLIDLGHTRIDFFDYERPDLPLVVSDRYLGYRKAIEEAGLDIASRARITVNLEEEGAIKTALKRLMSSKQAPSALFVHDDYFAAHLVSYLNGMGYGVPEDISIIAPGDTLDYNRPFVPRLTTMAIQTQMMGQLAGETMVKRLRSELIGNPVLKVSEKLRDRGSCIPHMQNGQKRDSDQQLPGDR